MKTSPIVENLLQVIFPSLCACCGEVLVGGERQLCLRCLSQIGQSEHSTAMGNDMERSLWGRFDFKAAASPFLFRKGNSVQAVVHAMKFRGNVNLCHIMGRQLGLSLLRSGRFDGVDLLMPVPLHWWRQLHRGYNQSLILCQGMAEVMHRPIECHALQRHRYTHQQSLRSGSNRELNVQGAFRLTNPSRIDGKHVLLVDDVMTTGSTLSACADALKSLPSITLSVATLCIAN